MSSEVKRYYWDTCAWLGMINQEQDKQSVLKHLWGVAQKGQCEIWTSTYTYLELIYKHPLHGEPYSPVADDPIIFAALEQPFVKRVQLDVEIAKLARQLRRELKEVLKKRSDAIHLATALTHNTDQLHTWDGSDLLPLHNRRQCRNGVLLPILKPGIGEDTPLMRAAAEKPPNGQ